MDLCTLDVVQLEENHSQAASPSETPPASLTPPLPSPSASTNQLSLTADSVVRSSLSSKLRNMPSRDSSARPSSKPTLEGLLGFGLAHALPQLPSPSANSARPQCHNFDLRKRGKSGLEELRFEWRREERSRKDWTVAVMGCPPISLSSHSPLPSSHLEPRSTLSSLSVPSPTPTLTQMQRTPSGDLPARPKLPVSSGSYDPTKASSTSSLVDPPPFSRSSSTSSEGPSPSSLAPLTPSTESQNGKWTLYLRTATSYGHKDLYALATLTPTLHHPLLVAHVSAPRLPKKLPEELGFTTDEVEECMSVLCLWLLVKECEEGAEGDWWKPRRK